jgi:hypothetical protein
MKVEDLIKEAVQIAVTTNTKDNKQARRKLEKHVLNRLAKGKFQVHGAEVSFNRARCAVLDTITIIENLLWRVAAVRRLQQAASLWPDADDLIEALHSYAEKELSKLEGKFGLTRRMLDTATIPQD